MSTTMMQRIKKFLGIAESSETTYPTGMSKQNSEIRSAFKAMKGYPEADEKRDYYNVDLKDLTKRGEAVIHAESMSGYNLDTVVDDLSNREQYKLSSILGAFDLRDRYEAGDLLRDTAGIDQIGSGCYRTVYEIGDYVIKCGSPRANEQEVVGWKKADKHQDILCPVTAHARTYDWIIMPKAEVPEDRHDRKRLVSKVTDELDLRGVHIPDIHVKNVAWLDGKAVVIDYGEGTSWA
ncbi:hypothetical protein M1M34_gp074 [Haloarcula tailed virus 2]|uniref:Uncharacterized protein n=1 Tax=Haloarcula tailed virus 2 TaxID=2877989 RepID=A0AAE9BYT9_9CAUD|nr:hypothetical protein M1M34_gp074 [Haloarcula tailed virus 2]UBF23259.1 hypothetical protein HATV-2_gp108 [Haloarcula tailed virus 2]